jgi:amino acid transporter
MGVLVFSLAALGLSRASNLILEIVPGRWPGIDLSVVVAIALGIGVFFTITFSSIGALIRRPAADYVLASRVIHPALGFVSSWVFAITLSFFAGNVAGSVARQTLPNLLKTLGTVFGMQDLLPLADTSASAQVAILIGTVVILVSFMVMIMPPRTVAWLLRIGLILVLVSWIAMMFLLLSGQGSSFTLKYDQIFGSGTYALQIEQAYQYGLESEAPAFRYVLMVGLLASFYLFFGAALPTLVSSEAHKPSKTLVPGSIFALLLAGGMTVASVLLLQQVVPIQFLSAQSYLTQKEIEVTGLALSWLPFYAAVIRPSLPVIALVGISWIYLLFLLVLVLMMSISRIFLAWARDGVIPAVVSYIHPHQKTPLLAALFAAVAAQIGLIDAVQGSPVFSAIHFAVFLSSSQLIPVTGLLLYPLLGRKAAGANRLPMRVYIFLAPTWLITLGYLIWSIVAVVVYPYQIQGIRPSTFTLLGLCFLSGVVWYLLRWFYLRRKCISLSEVFRSMPFEG